MAYSERSVPVSNKKQRVRLVVEIEGKELEPKYAILLANSLISNVQRRTSKIPGHGSVGCDIKVDDSDLIHIGSSC